MNVAPERGKQWYKLDPLKVRWTGEGRDGNEREKGTESWAGVMVESAISGKRPQGGLILSFSRSKYWNKLRLAPSTGSAGVEDATTTSPTSPSPAATSGAIPLQRDRAAASGVALITCSLHCASSWLKAPHLTLPRPRPPARVLPTLQPGFDPPSPASLTRLFVAGGCAR